MLKLKEKVHADFIEGKKKEKIFIDVAISHGYECIPASKAIDINLHWDVLIKKDGKKARTEIKGEKEAHKYGYTWIELINWEGNVGWLYGEADVLAIMHPDRFDIYLISSIRKLIEERVDKSLPILKSIPKKENGETDYNYMRFRQYNGFNRREDVSVIVSFEDINEFKISSMKR